MTSRGATGEVFDLGYQRYAGPREGRSRARRALFWDGVRTALGLGRGASQKVLPWGFIAVAMGPAVVLIVVAALASQIGNTGDVLEDLANRSYYQFAFTPLLLFASTVAPALLCPDRRERVIALYLVRPLSSMDYLTARILAFFAISLAVAYLPQVLIFASLSLSTDEPLRYLREQWLEVPRFLAAGFVVAAFTTSLGMAAASLTERRPVAAVIAIGFVIGTSTLFGIASSTSGGDIGRYLELLQPPVAVIRANDWIFGQPVERVPGPAYFGATTAFTVALLALLWTRYRRLAA
ncbi:MAG: ABC transporter permease subunit [Chloroflexi bacterium]|nr:ABC transporter permease subunit [Chloroflexota bacterium]